MSEKDLELKSAARHLCWQRGFATRIDVPLRIYVDRAKNHVGYEESTDLDVLSVDISEDGVVRLSIFDCKTSPKRSTERVFWLRGVADFISADNAWMVRTNKLTEAARQLANDLNIGVMTRNDLDTQREIDRYFEIPSHSAYQRLFEASSIASQRSKLNDRSQKLASLMEYTQYTFWAVDDPSRNLSLGVSALASAADALDPKNPIHVAIVWDCVWLYLLSLARGAEYVRRANASDVEPGLQEYFLGGQQGIRTKETTLRTFESLTNHTDQAILPDYFPMLLELFSRFYVRPRSFTDGMRSCEVLVGSLCAGKRTPLRESNGTHYDPVSAKLLSDCARFLIRSSKLNLDFWEVMKEMTFGGEKSQLDTSHQQRYSTQNQLFPNNLDDGPQGKLFTFEE